MMVKNFLESLSSLSKNKKSLLLVSLDTFLIFISFYLSFYLRLGEIKNFLNNDYLNIILIIVVINFLLFKFLPLYKIRLRFFNLNDLVHILINCIYLSLLIIFIKFLLNIFLPRSVPFIFLFISFSLLVLIRVFLKLLLNLKNQNKIKNKKIAIYGAGQYGKRIHDFLTNSRYDIALYIDDKQNLQGSKINSVDIISRAKFEKFLNLNSLDEVWIAISALNDTKKNEIIKFLSKYNLKIKVAPSIGSILLDDDLDDLFEKKEKVFDENTNLRLKNSFNNKNVVITGAGGSIGSELVKQVLNFNPAKLILVDNSETQLFKIYNKINNYNSNIKDYNIEIIPCLASIVNISEIEDIFLKHKIDIFLHAAAKKHVHLLEQDQNINQAFKTNVYGTYTCLELCKKYSVRNYALISTDKAVNPTSIMGSTKKCAESLVKYYQINFETCSNYKVVRFGNVIGSSGSALPIFINQIKKGGPLTITDKNMKRYFITIEEAAYLVLASITIESKEDYLFLLDMGNEINIYELAKKIIYQMGYTLKDENNKNGNIEIKIIGKKKGEKISEDLISDYEKIEDTELPKIKKIVESKSNIVDKKIIELALASNKHSLKEVKNIYYMLNKGIF